MGFMQALRDRWATSDSLVCVGLDPEPSKFPAHFVNDSDAIFNFCRDIVDVTAEYTSADRLFRRTSCRACAGTADRAYP